MNVCKFIQAKAKSIKDLLLSACGGGVRYQFIRSKKHLAYGKELNMLPASTVSKAQKIKKSSKAKVNGNYDSNSYHKLEQFNFKDLGIGGESGTY